MVGEVVSASHSVHWPIYSNSGRGRQDILERLPSEVVKRILGIPFVVDVLHDSEP